MQVEGDTLVRREFRNAGNADVGCLCMTAGRPGKKGIGGEYGCCVSVGRPRKGGCWWVGAYVQTQEG